MSHTGIDLNDSALALAAHAAQGPTLVDIDGGHHSHGYAGKGGLAGNAARAIAQRSPQSVTDQAWERLSSEPATSLGSALGATWAELATQHLAVLGGAMPAGSAALLALPELWRTRGHDARASEAAHAAGLPTVGTIDRALAAASIGCSFGLATGAELMHLDLLRAQAVLTTLHFDGTTLGTTNTAAPIPSSGYRALENDFMTGLDARMAEESGVLPSEHPELAQALYDQLPQILAALRSASSVSLKTSSASMVLTRDQAAGFCKRLTQRLVRGVESACESSGTRGARLLKLGGFAAEVPGLREALASVRGLVVEELPAGHAALGAAHLCAALNLPTAARDTPPEPITQIAYDLLAGYADLAPIDKAATSAAPSTDSEQAPGRQFHTGPNGFITRDAPTHLLFQGRAVPLEASPFSIGRDPGEGAAGVRIVEDFPGLAPVHAQLTRDGSQWHAAPGPSGAPLLLNRRPLAEPTPIQTGDVLTLGDTGLKAMFVRTLD